MFWRTDKPKGSPIVVYREGNKHPEILFLGDGPNPQYYDDGGEEIPTSMIIRWASLGYEPSMPSNVIEAADEYAEHFLDSKDKSCSYHGFRCGVEWCAEQGISMPITDDTEWEDVDSFVHKNVTGGCVIQIRKN